MNRDLLSPLPGGQGEAAKGSATPSRPDQRQAAGLRLQDCVGVVASCAMPPVRCHQASGHRWFRANGSRALSSHICGLNGVRLMKPSKQTKGKSSKAGPINITCGLVPAGPHRLLHPQNIYFWPFYLPARSNYLVVNPGHYKYFDLQVGPEQFYNCFNLLWENGGHSDTRAL